MYADSPVGPSLLLGRSRAAIPFCWQPGVGDLASFGFSRLKEHQNTMSMKLHIPLLRAPLARHGSL